MSADPTPPPSPPPYRPLDERWSPPPARTGARDRLVIAFVSVVAALGIVGSGLFAGLLGARLVQGHGVHAPAVSSVLPRTQAAGHAPLQTTQSGTASFDQSAIVDVNTVVQGATSSGQAAGTGMIISSTGDIVTNHHVIQGAIKISVAVQGAGTYTATVVGADPTHDVALIHINAGTSLPTVSFGDSAKLSVGDPVTAIGNALGKGGAPTVTRGSVTALDQSIQASDGPGSPVEELSHMIQTDAGIQPGDSGGALVVSRNQVVGMITAGTVTRSGRRGGSVSGTGAGFAIPSADVVSEINLIRSGNAGSSIIMGVPGFLGVSVSDSTTRQSGAVIGTVVPGSPAEKAGLQAGDVLTTIGGVAISGASAVGTAIHAHKPGEAIDITWVNGNGTHRAKVTLVSGPAA